MAVGRTVVIGALLAASAAAGETPPAVLDIDRLFASPDLSGPAPRAVAISPDSRRVTFLRGGGKGEQVDGVLGPC